MNKPDFTILKNNRSFWHNPVIVILGTLLLFFTSQIVGIFLASPFSTFVTEQNYQTVLFIAMNLLVMLAILTVVMLVVGFNWKQLGWKNTGWRAYLKIVPAFLMYFIASAVFTYLATKYINGFNVEQSQDVGFSKVNSLPVLIATFMSLVIFTPFVEEIIFRGVLFRGLRKRVPFWASAVIVSIVFALAHMQWNVAVDTFALSLVLCYLAEKTNSIFPSILLHGIKNSLAFILLFVVK